MLKPFYQGKLDTFCAIYAVINALRLIMGLRSSKGREILNSTLLGLSARPSEFSRVLSMETDYIELVDNMLATQSAMLPIEVSQPYRADERVPDVDKFWDKCASWIGDQRENGKTRTMVFRFLRFLNPGDKPLNRHWTTADYMDGNILRLFDCSHEAEAILNINRNSFVTRREDVDREHLLLIQPDSVRFVRLKF